VNITKLAQTYLLSGRLREILTVFAKNGFMHFIQDLRLIKFVPMASRVKGSLAAGGNISAHERLRVALEELGPTFIKLGQLLSTRPDLIGETFAEELGHLRDDVAPFSFEAVTDVVKRQTGKEVHEIFERFEITPVAAASIGQVHRAKLRDGGWVVVKIRRPAIDKIVSGDISVLQLILSIAENYMPEIVEMEFHVILDEFSRTIRRELDFFLEAANTERLGKLLANNKNVVIPRVWWEYSGEEMVVLEEVVGHSPNNLTKLREKGIDPEMVARILSRAFFKQVLIDGVYHADLHAGNIIITDEGKVALLDFGAVGFLSEAIQESLGNFFLSIVTGDYAALTDEFIKIGYCDDIVDARAFERDLREFIEPYQGRPLGGVSIGAIMKEGMRIALRHKVQVPPEFVMLGRTTMEVESVIRKLAPDLVVFDEVMPYTKKLLLRKVDMKRQMKNFYRVGRDYKNMLEKLPNQISRILQRVLESRLSIEFVHRGYERVLTEMDRVTNRISISIVIGSLIVGSSLIVLSGKGPMLWDFPIFGIVGFLFAAFLGLGLVLLIIRSGKL